MTATPVAPRLLILLLVPISFWAPGEFFFQSLCLSVQDSFGTVSLRGLIHAPPPLRSCEPCHLLAITGSFACRLSPVCGSHSSVSLHVSQFIFCWKLDILVSMMYQLWSWSPCSRGLVNRCCLVTGWTVLKSLSPRENNDTTLYLSCAVEGVETSTVGRCDGGAAVRLQAPPPLAWRPAFSNLFDKVTQANDRCIGHPSQHCL